MTINAFEGARRIVIFTQVAAVCLSIGFILFDPSDPRLTYITTYPGDMFQLADEKDCIFLTDKRIDQEAKTSDGEPIKFTLCFKTYQFGDGKAGIPYKIENGKIFGDGYYSENVGNYIKEAAKSFSLPQEAASDSRKLWWKAQYERAKLIIKFCLGWCLGIFFFSTVVGWIIRGFFQIPNGSDTKAI